MRESAPIGTTTKVGVTVRSQELLHVGLVEDHPVVLLGLEVLISAQRDMKIIGKASGIDDGLDLAAHNHPDVMVVPLRLHGEWHGIELCRSIKNLASPPKVVICTSFPSTEEVAASFLSGADAFVYKGAETSRLLDTIRGTSSGNRAWVPAVEPADSAEHLRAIWAQSDLTSREQEVLGLMLQHFTNAQIADELVVGMSTVKTHVRNILGKLGITSRRDLFEQPRPDDSA